MWTQQRETAQFAGRDGEVGLIPWTSDIQGHRNDDPNSQGAQVMLHHQPLDMG